MNILVENINTLDTFICSNTGNLTTLEDFRFNYQLWKTWLHCIKYELFRYIILL